MFVLAPAVAELLLTQGSLVNETNEQGNSSLHVACAFGMIELRSLYSAYGALQQKNIFGKTPKDIYTLMPHPSTRLQIPSANSVEYDEGAGGVVLESSVTANISAIEIRPQRSITSRVQGFKTAMKF